MGYKEYEDAKEAERLEAHPERDKIKAIQALLAKEKDDKRAAMDVKEEKFSGEAEMQMHLKQYRDGNIVT